MLNATFECLYSITYVGSPCPSREQPKSLIYISRLCTIQVDVCLTALGSKESILLITLVHVLSLIVKIYDKVNKRNIRQSFEGCRQTFEGYKMTFVYALVIIISTGNKTCTVQS